MFLQDVLYCINNYLWEQVSAASRFKVCQYYKKVVPGFHTYLKVHPPAPLHPPDLNFIVVMLCIAVHWIRNARHCVRPQFATLICN